MNFSKPALFALAGLMVAQMPFSLAADNGANPIREHNLLSQAQTNIGTEKSCGKHHGRHHKGKFFQELNLTESQQSQLKAMMATKRQKHQSFRQQMQSILTPAQQARMKELKAERKANKGQFQRGELMSQLNLTDSQKARLEALKASRKQEREAFHQQMMGILTPEQKQKLQTLKEQNKGRWSKKQNG